MNYNKDFLPITNICLNITETCNLNCRYCFTEQREHTMTLQVAKDTAKWLYDNAKITNELNGSSIIPMINFFGGEPTLCYESIIVPLVEWIAEQGWQFKYGITTNGILLTQDKIDFFIKHNIGVLLSADGAKNTQDYNRPFKNSNNSSFDILNKNIPYLLEKMPNTTFRSTIIPDTANYFFENIIYAASMGFKHSFAIINEFEKWSEENRYILEQELFKYSLYLIDCFAENKDFIHFHPLEKAFQQVVSIYFNRINNIENENYYNINCKQCGFGNGYGSVNYAGDIFTCQEVASRKERELFAIGNIYTGINYTKLLNKNSRIFMREFFNVVI